MESTILETNNEIPDHVKKRTGIDLLMRLSAVGSVNRNLKTEDAEMKDWYNRQNDLLDGGSNGELETIEETNDMLVAGDNNNTINHNYYEKAEEKKPEEKKAVDVQIPQKIEEKKTNPLVEKAITAALTVGLLGVGGVVGNSLNDTSEPIKPPVVNTHQIEDTDTIGVLEPDKE